MGAMLQMGLPGCLTKPTEPFLSQSARWARAHSFLREIPSEATGATEEFIGGWERGGQQGQAGGGSARISPWELSQPRRAGLLGTLLQLPGLPACLVAGVVSSAPSQRAPERGRKGEGHPWPCEAEAQAPSSAAREEFNYHQSPPSVSGLPESSLPFNYISDNNLTQLAGKHSRMQATRGTLSSLPSVCLSDAFPPLLSLSVLPRLPHLTLITPVSLFSFCRSSPAPSCLPQAAGFFP